MSYLLCWNWQAVTLLQLRKWSCLHYWDWQAHNPCTERKKPCLILIFDWNAHRSCLLHWNWQAERPHLIYWDWQVESLLLLHWDWKTWWPHLLFQNWHAQTPSLLHFDWQATHLLLELTELKPTACVIAFYFNCSINSVWLKLRCWFTFKAIILRSFPALHIGKVASKLNCIFVHSCYY